jgi:MFS transporter, DHA1 family, multidrug resistance protein
LMNLMVTVGPGVAPIVGAALAATLGWRSIFYALCGLGICNFLFTWKLLPETAGVDQRANQSVGRLAHNYWQLLKSPKFLGYSIGGGCATTASYGFIASAPFIFVHQLHRPAHEVGIYLAMLIFGIWIGSVIATRLIKRVPLKKLLVRANAFSVLGSLTLLAAAVSGHLSVAIVMASMLVFTIGVGIASPAALSEAISVNPLVIGSASGLYGFMQMAVGALCTALVGLGTDLALSSAIVLVAAGVLGQTAFWIAGRRVQEQARK